MKNILLLTDNKILLNRFKALIQEKNLENNSSFNFDYAFSFNNEEFVEIFKTRSGDKKERFLKLLLKNGYLILKINDCSF